MASLVDGTLVSGREIKGMRLLRGCRKAVVAVDQVMLDVGGDRTPHNRTRGYEIQPAVWIFATSSNLKGMENENVAPGPSLGVAHKRPL
jgi:hypothetical protein